MADTSVLFLVMNLLLLLTPTAVLRMFTFSTASLIATNEHQFQPVGSSKTQRVLVLRSVQQVDLLSFQVKVQILCLMTRMMSKMSSYEIEGYLTTPHLLSPTWLSVRTQRELRKILH